MPDPILRDLPHRPARLTRVDDGTEITGPGVRAVWEAGPGADGQAPQGLRLGTFRRFAEPEGDTLPFQAGRLLDSDGRPMGRVETARLAPDAAVHGGGESHLGPNLRGRHRLLRDLEGNRAAGRDSVRRPVPGPRAGRTRRGGGDRRCAQGGGPRRAEAEPDSTETDS